MCSVPHLSWRGAGVLGDEDDREPAQVPRNGNRHREEGVEGHRFLSTKDAKMLTVFFTVSKFRTHL